MIILATLQETNVQPIVIIDYTRSDENYTDTEIKQYSDQVCSDFTTGRTVSSILKPKVFSLNYSYTYTHSGMSFGDAKRTQFTASILNAPNELVGLLRIKEVISKVNLAVLADSLSRVADSEVTFPTGSIIVRDQDQKVITKPFTIYSTPFEPDRFRVDNRLMLKGGSYEDVVLRLNLSVNLKKGNSLKSALLNLFSDTNYTVAFGFTGDLDIAVSKYYPPAPLNNILEDVCRDNKLTFKRQDSTYTFLSLSPNTPPLASFKNKLSFLNSISGTFLVSNLTFTNYAIANIDCEMFNVTLFESIAVYDDSGSNAFFNLNKISNLSTEFDAYQFYVIGYTINDSRDATYLNILGSNNWLLNNIRIDALFEPAIYRELLT